MVDPVHAEIAIIDDDAGHRTLVRRSLQRVDVTATIREHEDAAEAMAWLQAEECPPGRYG